MTVYCDCEKCENNEDGFCYAEKIYMSDGGVCLSCRGIVDEESEDVDKDKITVVIDTGEESRR